MSIGVLINHAIAFCVTPIAVALALIVLGIVFQFRGRRLVSRLLLISGAVYLWVMSMGITYRWLGLGLEREFPPQRVEELPKADAIVVLGGGVTGNTNVCPYAELFPAADRVAHAARIWKAGKAPTVILSGSGELGASFPLLQEWGVPKEAILVENVSGNTEENARFVAGFVKKPGLEAKPKVLLVTSAWHMRRALLMFRKYAHGIEVVPAACDYEATVDLDRFEYYKSFLPSADSLYRNTFMIKEIVGYYGYKFLRR